MKQIFIYLKKIFSSKPNYSIEMKQFINALPEPNSINSINFVYFICDILSVKIEIIEDYLLKGKLEELINKYKATTQTNNISIYLVKTNSNDWFYYFIEDNMELYKNDKLIKILHLTKSEISINNYKLIYQKQQ